MAKDSGWSLQNSTRILFAPQQAVILPWDRVLDKCPRYISKRVRIWGYLDELLQHHSPMMGNIEFIQGRWTTASTASEELSCSSRWFGVTMWRGKGRKIASSPKWERLLVPWPLFPTLKLMEHSSPWALSFKAAMQLHGPQPITITRFFFFIIIRLVIY